MDIIHKSLTNFYSDCYDYLKKLDDYIVLAIDGSKIKLPNDESTRKEFKLSEKGIVNRKSAMATFSAVTDVYNEFVLDSVMVKHQKKSL
jgi:hypothetical protein